MPPLTTLRVYYFVSFVVLGLYLPYFPRWLEARGVQGLAMGVIVATTPAMALIGPPCFGLLADALALRGSILRVACAGALLAFSVVAWRALGGRPLGFGVLFTLAVVFAFFRSPMFLIADVIALEHVKAAGTSYPRMRLWGSLGFLVAAIAGGRWLDLAAPAPLPVAIAIALLAALGASLGLPRRATLPPRPVPERVRALLRARDFRLFLAASCLGQAAHSAYDLCYSLHLRDAGISSGIVGVAWALGVLAEVVLMAGSTRFVHRGTAPRMLVVAFGGAAIRWALVATVSGPVFQLALQPFHALSFGLMWIASVAYIRERVGPRVLATAQGLFGASAAAGSVVGMLAWSVLYRDVGGRVTFGIAAVVSALACVCASVFAKAAPTDEGAAPLG